MIKKILLLLIILYGCRHAHDQDSTSLVKELMKTDRDFSQLSILKGTKEAFLYYAEDSVIIMRQGYLPLIGKTALLNHYKSFPDNEVNLTWTPVKAEVSGNLGYTFGDWKLTFNGKDSIQYGNYITIWKHFPDGRWKYILDAGNSTPKQDW